MFGLGMGEALILLAVTLLFFGGKRIPELGRSLGKSINHFKKGLSEKPDSDSDTDSQG